MAIPVGEPFFLDTNILLAACDLARTTHLDCLRVITETGASGRHPVTSLQVFREFMVVATRPLENNGLGLTSLEAIENIKEFRHFCAVLEPQPAEWQHLERLVATLELKGKRIHDANIAATMLSSGIEWLTTDNPTDFNGIDEIKLLTSKQCAASL